MQPPSSSTLNPGTRLAAPDPLLRLFLDGRPRTRAEIIAESGMARSTVAPRLEGLARIGVLTERTGPSTRGGRPPTVLELNGSFATVAAVAVEGECLRVALADLQQHIVAERRIDEPLAADPEQTFDTVEQLIVDLVRTHELAPLVGVGVSLTMPVDPRTGRPIHPAHRPRWHDYDVAGRLQPAFAVPVHVDGMNNRMALGELSLGGEDTENLLFVHASTWIGAGVVIDGHVAHGATGQVGHIGHVRGHWDEDDECTCGKRGCLEAVASGSALLRRFGGLIGAESIATVIEAAKDGDTDVLAAVRESGRKIGSVVAGYVSVLNPATIVLSGELADAGTEFFTGVREGINRDAFPMSITDLVVRPSRAGDAAAIIGSAQVAAHYFLAPGESSSDSSEP